MPLRFTPTASKFADQLCGGISIVVTNRQQCDPLAVGFEIGAQLRRLFPDEWEVAAYNRLLADRAVWESVQAAESRQKIMKLYQDELNQFLIRRSAWLLY